MKFEKIRRFQLLPEVLLCSMPVTSPKYVKTDKVVIEARTLISDQSLSFFLSFFKHCINNNLLKASGISQYLLLSVDISENECYYYYLQTFSTFSVWRDIITGRARFIPSNLRSTAQTSANEEKYFFLTTKHLSLCFSLLHSEMTP